MYNPKSTCYILQDSKKKTWKNLPWNLKEIRDKWKSNGPVAHSEFLNSIGSVDTYLMPSVAKTLLNPLHCKYYNLHITDKRTKSQREAFVFRLH